MRFCKNCGGSVGDAAYFCLKCGSRLKTSSSSETENPLHHAASTYADSSMGAHPVFINGGLGQPAVQFEKPQIVGTVGSVMLFMGTFCPAFSATIFTATISINLINGGRGDGRYLIGIAVIVALFTLFKRYWFTFAGGAISLLVVVVDIIDAGNKLGSARGLVSYDWGLGVLVIASVIMMATPFVPREMQKRLL